MAEHGTPMCALWYGRAGNYRPWHRRAEGCTCGVNAHALPEHHDRTCPAYLKPDQRELLARLIPGEPER